MKHNHIPSIDIRYWTLISIASVLGANVGDFLSEVLDLGNVSGLPVLIAFLVVLYALERLDKSTHEFYYWGTIVAIRAAATNIGDYSSMDLHLSKPLMIGVLTLALVVAIFVGRSFADSVRAYTRQADGKAYPAADPRYWISMLIAGTLGTVAGDFMSYGGYHIGNVYSSAILSTVLAACFLIGRNGLLIVIPYYWLTVVAVRSAGTAVGDMLADPDVFGMGLTISTALSALVFVVLIAVWRGRPLRPALAD
jgi:uncharacterized membrane-anchored protein